jgi:hypothetical protein
MTFEGARVAILAGMLGFSPALGIVVGMIQKVDMPSEWFFRAVLLLAMCSICFLPAAVALRLVDDMLAVAQHLDTFCVSLLVGALLSAAVVVWYYIDDLRHSPG